jgi:hypothetical protein
MKTSRAPDSGRNLYLQMKQIWPPKGGYLYIQSKSSADLAKGWMAFGKHPEKVLWGSSWATEPVWQSWRI